jgi:hypothetical protein
MGRGARTIEVMAAVREISEATEAYPYLQIGRPTNRRNGIDRQAEMNN